MIPLSLRIKKTAHRRIALAQDIIVDEVYKEFDRAVLHGGTSIWRCYFGKRFSEDLDFYIPKDERRVKQVFKNIERRGFSPLKKRISETSVYSEFERDRERVRLEAIFKRVDGVIADYETADGNVMSVYSLTPEYLIKEKIETYLKRYKIRDLYDIFFLMKSVKDPNKIKAALSTLIKTYRPPFDETDLKSIIIEGIVPTSKEMIEYIQRKWENANTSTQ